MILLVVSILLSAGIVAAALAQGGRCFGGYAQTSQSISDLSAKLDSCAEGVSFREVLQGWLSVEDATTRNLVRQLSRTFDKDALDLGGRTGWVVDLELLCDARVAYRSHASAPRAEAMAGILTGAGILFTFLGLTIGVYGLDPTDGAQLTEGVRRLLGGMSLAFLTSIAGIGSSLWWTWRNKLSVQDFDEAYASLFDTLSAKPFLFSPEALQVQMAANQAQQTENMGKLGETLSEAFEKAFAKGIQDLKETLTMAESKERMNAIMEGIRKELVQMGRFYGENAELNRKLNQVLNQLVKEGPGGGDGASANATSALTAAIAGDPNQVVANLGQIQQIQGESMAALQASTKELNLLIKSARVANADMAKAHQTIEVHLQGLQEHWRTYRDQIETMQQALTKTLTGFGDEMQRSMGEIHGEFDKLLAESLTHFAKSLKDMETAVQAMTVLSKTDEGKKPLLGRRK